MRPSALISVRRRSFLSGPRRVGVAAGEGELERLAFDRDQLAGREPRRPPGRLARLDQLDAGKARELLRSLEDLVHARACRCRAGDGADELGHGEGRPLLGQPVAAEQAGGELLALDLTAWNRASGDERFEFAAAEAVLGRARLPVLAQPRQVDLLLRLPGRERGNAGGGEALGAECLHVLEQRLPPGRECPDRLLGSARDLAHALDRLRPLDAEPDGSARAGAAPRTGSRRRAGRS